MFQCSNVWMLTCSEIQMFKYSYIYMFLQSFFNIEISYNNLTILFQEFNLTGYWKNGAGGLWWNIYSWHSFVRRSQKPMCRLVGIGFWRIFVRWLQEWHMGGFQLGEWEPQHPLAESNLWCEWFSFYSIFGTEHIQSCWIMILLFDSSIGRNLEVANRLLVKELLYYSDENDWSPNWWSEVN